MYFCCNRYCKYFEFSNPRDDKPVLLILDGHASHTKSIELINRAKETHAVILCLPPHCTHRFQPLDVTFMPPLSTYYEHEMRQWLIEYPGKPVTICQIATLFGRAFGRAAVIKTAVNTFKQTGTIPFDSNAIPEPSETTDQPQAIVTPSLPQQGENPLVVNA